MRLQSQRPSAVHRQDGKASEKCFEAVRILPMVADIVEKPTA
jgi:hypothetical protein